MAQRLHWQWHNLMIHAERRDQTMSQRETNLLWMRDLLEHLTACQQQLEWAQDGDTVRVLTESMLADLERCKRLCESLNRRAAPRTYA
jgi:hypothetical protein